MRADEALVLRLALITGSGNRIVVVINSGTTIRMAFEQKSILGIPPVCYENASATIYDFESISLKNGAVRTIKNFAAQSLTDVKGVLFVAGEALDGCSMRGVASVARLTDSGKPQLIWVDSEPFPSSTRGMAAIGDLLILAVDHERILGIEFGKSTYLNFNDKRWADDNKSAREASLIRLSGDGLVVDQRYFTAGLSIFPQGVTVHGGKAVVYGSLGGLPAFFEFSLRWVYYSEVLKPL